MSAAGPTYNRTYYQWKDLRNMDLYTSSTTHCSVHLIWPTYNRTYYQWKDLRNIWMYTRALPPTVLYILSPNNIYIGLPPSPGAGSEQLVGITVAGLDA